MEAAASVSQHAPLCRATRAIVDLDAIAANVRVFRALAPAAVLIAAVKGDAYGHGAVPVASAALKAGAGYLAVYTLDEAAALRHAGIRAPILLLGPLEMWEASVVWKLRLAPTISDFSAVRLLESAADGSRLPVHLKVDTGLTRAGASPRDAIVLARAVWRHPALELASVFTHFARADEPHSGSSQAQLRIFAETVHEMEAQGIRPQFIHAANTAGTLNVPEARLGAVRVGIGLYGYDPTRPDVPSVPLVPALSLVSRLTRVTRVGEGTGVGYGHEFRGSTGCTIGLVPIGYGDGLPRSLGLGRGRVLVRGTPVPVVGRMSMDQITVDLTSVPDARVGDDVVLIGSSGRLMQSAHDLGDQAGTISYDILTGLLPRVPRIYIEDSKIVSMSRLGGTISVNMP